MTSTGTSAASTQPIRRPAPPGSNRRWWAIVFAVALLVRAGWGLFGIVAAEDPSRLEFPDERQYWSMAQSFRAGEGLRDELGFLATRMPLYPAALSLVAGLPQGVTVAKAVHWIIGAAAAALTAGLAGALLDRRVGLLAGLLVAFDPFLVFFSSLLLTESAFAAALVGLVWMLTPLVRSGRGSAGRWTLVGLVAALAVYVRESSLGLVVVLLAFVVLCRRFNRRTLAGAVLAMVIVVAALTPWAARNKRVVGEWCWLTTRGGISLYDGVGPQATGASNLGDIKQMPAVRGKTEVDWNRYFLSESLKAMRADPGRIARLAGVKMARMWNPVPNVETYQSLLVRAVSAAWTVPIFVCAVAGVWMLRARQRGEGVRLALFLLLPALYLTLLHSLFVGSVRYRLGAMPMLEVLAALAVVGIMDRLHNGAATTESSVVD